MQNFVETAISKLKEEMEKAKDNAFAEPIIEFLIKRCNEDNGLCEDVCQEHKTWEKCFKYIYEEAKKMAKGKQSCAVRDDVVFEWAEDYYHKDDKAEEEEKAKKEAERKQKEAEKKATGTKSFEDTATREWKAKAKAEREANTTKESEKEKTVIPVQSVKKGEPIVKKAEKISKTELKGQMSIFDFV